MGSGGEIWLKEEVVPGFQRYLMLHITLFHYQSCPLLSSNDIVWTGLLLRKRQLGQTAPALTGSCLGAGLVQDRGSWARLGAAANRPPQVLHGPVPGADLCAGREGLGAVPGLSSSCIPSGTKGLMLQKSYERRHLPLSLAWDTRICQAYLPVSCSHNAVFWLFPPLTPSFV